MKKLMLPLLIFVYFLLTPLFSSTHAATTFQTGYYTNLCGTSTAATGDTCNQGCDPTTGQCKATNVVKFTCDGASTQCRNNMSDFAKSQSLASATCGKTVEIDVYTKKCQTLFGWFCGDNDKTDYMVWYSGDCTGTSPNNPTPTITPAQTTTCNSLTITNGNNGLIPATLTFAANTSGAVGAYRYYFGDGTFIETASPQASHQYQASGQFIARAFVKDINGSWVTSPSCEAHATVAGLPVETQQSACSNVFITQGNYTKAPTTMTFEVTGYDNKGAISQYKMDFGNGQTLTQTSNTFSYQYATAGTYVARGYVLDTQNRWLTADSCTQVAYATTQTLTQQPGTGTPTWFTIIALASGLIGASMIVSVTLSPKAAKVNHKKRAHRS